MFLQKLFDELSRSRNHINFLIGLYRYNHNPLTLTNDFGKLLYDRSKSTHGQKKPNVKPTHANPFNSEPICWTYQDHVSTYIILYKGQLLGRQQYTAHKSLKHCRHVTRAQVHDHTAIHSRYLRFVAGEDLRVVEHEGSAVLRLKCQTLSVCVYRLRIFDINIMLNETCTRSENSKG